MKLCAIRQTALFTTFYALPGKKVRRERRKNGTKPALHGKQRG
jgi:hypothetical protein